MTERKISINEIQDHPDNDAEENQKMKYPKSIFFIVSNEFCERFSYYGMRTILTLYLKNQLMYSSNTSTVIYHIFSMMVYFFPLFGAMLADSLLGKFRTIFYLSIVYAIGQILLSLSAAPPLGLPNRECSLLSLLLIAIGTGGIKPCVAAFGGDQFVLPQQERYLSTFFSLFYFSINSGSLISSFLMPIIRNDIACFGENTCYSLAFFVPAVLMILSIILFIFGKPLYKIVKPTGNVVLNVSKCISHAIYKKVTSKDIKRDFWLDYADDKYDKLLINDIKAALQVMILFIPIPIFWALFDQQGSRWTFQATRMNGEIGNFLLQPDQMQVFNPFLVLAFIPLFETCLYPIMMKFGFRTPLRIMVIGGFLAALSFVVAAIVEFQLESTYPVLPSKNFAQLRIFNTLNCSIEGKLQDENELSQELSFIIKSMNMWENKYIKANGQKNFNYVVNFTTCNEAGITNISQSEIKGNIFVFEAEANSWIITPEGFSDHYKDSIDKSRTGDPLVRGLIFINTLKSVSLELMKDGTSFLKLVMNSTFDKNEELNSIKPNTYDIHLDGKKVQSNVSFKLGGVYTILGSVIENETNAAVVTVTDPNSVHILWLIPQYVIITMSEVMFSVTGLEFAFTQAPSSMKSLLQACWLLTVAFGNLIVVIVAEVSIFNRQAHEFLLFAALMFVDVIIFAVMAKLYKYVNTPENEEITENIQMNEKDGIINKAFKNDQ
ncbi:peptide transporter family 1 isoform X2 [Apis laboriosa]|uniref:peptide transporter family 1 isoform X2 n=1 Tax=Apis laboriosa TaxID=183418 RepID=UPI001CC5BC22|nr:peptide transporter family 1 isoform X2 [Apis laboriosa]